MFIKLDYLIQKYGLKINGVIHCGAHHAEEHEDYVKAHISNITYIEPCAPAFAKLAHRFEHNPNIILHNAACGNSFGTVPMFTETRNTGQSNSILKPKKHLEQFPDIKFTGKEIVRIQTLDSLNCTGNFLNIDVQGYEGEVLKGATETIKHIDYIYTEVNRAEIYEGCAQVDELDLLLSDFTRVETSWAGGLWGDGFYVRKTLL